MKPIKYSRQRESIVNFLVTRKDHPTADDIYNHLRRDYPNLSLGTVYRNLSLLTELGEIQKISCGTGPDRFDGNPVPHYHFLCTECGAVSDLEISSLPELTDIASEGFAGTITGYELHFYGKCPQCNETN